METKPYNLQSPEQIAKDYGGNKQKIAEAMQMGILDPTAGTLAAMFIDRMRNAAQTEAAPQQTVAQQAFAPPMPQMPQGMPQMPRGAPAGLGATPEAAAMPAPAEAVMGAPSAQPMPGMAEGGMVPPYASGGGLSDLPVPDGMFDEPSNGGFNDGYRGGGLVAFREGTDEEGVQSDEPPETVGTKDILVNAKKAPKFTPTVLQGTMYQAPSVMGGYGNTLGENIGKLDTEVTRETKRAQQYQEYLDRMLDPEEQKKRRQEDMWAAIGQIGARMAQTPGSLLQAASAGVGEALPGIAAAAKERRGEERAAQQARVAEERTGNKEVQDRAGIALDMLKSYNTLEQAFQDQNFKNTLTRLGFDVDLAGKKVMAGAGIREALISSAATRDVGALGYSRQRGTLYQQIASDWDKNSAMDKRYTDLFAKDPVAAAAYRDSKIMGSLDRIMPALGGGDKDPAGIR